MLFQHFLVAYWCLPLVSGFVSPLPSNRGLVIQLDAKQSRSSGDSVSVLDDEETPAGVTGAEFFGGNTVKDELFDPVAEQNAGKEILVKEEKYNRFQDLNAFPDDLARGVAQSLQSQINAVLYTDSGENSISQSFQYGPSLTWETPFPTDKSSSSPLKELEKALDFYNRVDAAIVSAKSTSSGSVVARWEISIVWPNFWESRVLLTGSSILTLQDDKVVKQVDQLDGGKNDVLGAVTKQVIPRFWDSYHIGMTPSAERTPRLASNAQKGFFSSYELFEIPSRVVLKPSILDIGSREDGCAQFVPNHAFSTLIQTMGPKRERYTTTSPVEVQISRGENNNPRISWTIPLSVELLSSDILPSPCDDPETPEEAMADCTYEYQSRRLVATLPYGGSPQDSEVSDIRKQIYDQVVKDGLKPKLDSNGRPQFFFLQNDAKACYTENGLGMSVYDWRPKSVKANEVGIELELPSENGIEKM
mmetsp:Transcript_13486/g.19062  ORF Transcript_13486/g.19062 Transcript_13486/m.19062 type:complete len:475 (-) Transcript_13486:240-1664(-)